MPINKQQLYIWEAQTLKNNKTTGIIDAKSQRKAKHILKSKGNFKIRIKEIPVSIIKSPLKTKELLRFLNSLIMLLKAGLPLIDALDVLDLLLKLGYKDERMQDAIDLIISKQNKNGRWLLEKSFNTRMQIKIEQLHKESKWVTLFALRVLKRFYS